MATRTLDQDIARARAEELEAKQPVTAVAGPYGHPFHPILVTIPIGAWVSSLVFDIASRNADNGGELARGAYWLIAIGIIGALIAAVFGLLDFLALPRGTPAKRVGLTHLGLNLTVVALFVASFVWRADRGAELRTNAGLFVLSGVALCLLLISGWLGGRLAYRFGVRVADEETQLDGFVHNRRGRR